MATVIVIEDDREVLEYLAYLLGQAGHMVTAVDSGRGGVAQYLEKPAQVVITDIIMPDMDGIETIIELRRYDPSVKIIAISGGGDLKSETYLRSARLLGADRTLSKPFNNEDILAAVTELASEADGHGA